MLYPAFQEFINLIMQTRREFLLTGIALATVGVPARGFDADNASVRYRAWLATFKRDFERLSSDSIGGKEALESRVGAVCRESIVPGSRADYTVREWVKEPKKGEGARRGAMRYASLGDMVVMLLENSIPAGHGGAFPEPAGSPYLSSISSVWYMHIGRPDFLQTYFDDKEQFPSYELPPDGTLKRHAYPFLLFEDTADRLRLAGIGAEWMGAALYLYRKQFA